MRKTDLGYLIPPQYYSDSLPTKDEREFRYIGQENILFLSAVWFKRASELLEKGMASSDIDERMIKVSEAQECQDYGKRLQEIATLASSKPLFFQEDAFRAGDHVTCFISNPSENLRGDLKRRNRFLDTVIMGIERNKEQVLYSVVLCDKKPKEEAPKKYRFVPDHISAIATDDFHYFKLHPNFFRLYLNVRATNALEREKIEPILSAL